MMKLTAVAPMIVLGVLASGLVYAAPRDAGGSPKVVAKLQTMVRDISSERDALKTERDAIKAENEKLVAELDKLKQERAAAAAAESRLNAELSSQKSHNDEISGRLDQTTAKLHEVIDKYNALNKAKNELSVEHGNLQKSQKLTSAELSSCESKNLKLYEATREIIDNYQKRGIVDTLLESEPVFGIHSVEMETLLQEYQDKLNKQKYQKTAVVHEPAEQAPEGQPR